MRGDITANTYPPNPPYYSNEFRLRSKALEAESFKSTSTSTSTFFSRDLLIYLPPTSRLRHTNLPHHMCNSTPTDFHFDVD